MIKFLRICWYQSRVTMAQQNVEYWSSEVERCAHNVDIAKYHVDYYQRKLHHARYPVGKSNAVNKMFTL